MNALPDFVAVPAAQAAIARELRRDGADNATIARRLGLTESSVATYMHRLLEATGYPHRTALAVGILRGQVRVTTVDARRA